MDKQQGDKKEESKKDERPRKLRKVEEQEEKKQKRKDLKKKRKEKLMEGKKAAQEGIVTLPPSLKTLPFTFKNRSLRCGDVNPLLVSYDHLWTAFSTEASSKAKIEKEEEPIDDSNLQFGLFDFSTVRWREEVLCTTTA